MGMKGNTSGPASTVLSRACVENNDEPFILPVGGASLQTGKVCALYLHHDHTWYLPGKFDIFD